MHTDSRPARRSSLFLMELTLAILFFCLCSAFCVRLFAQAREVSRSSENLTMSVRQLSGFAELFKGSSDFESALLDACPLARTGDSRFTVYYDQDWQYSTEEEAVYSVEIQLSREGNLAVCDMRALSLEKTGAESGTLYTLHTEKYCGEGIADE